MIRNLNNNKGESLLEILFAITLLSIVLLVFLRAITSLVTMSSKTEDRMDGSFMAQRCMEYLSQQEGRTIANFRSSLTSSTDFTCTELSADNPYSYRIDDPKYPDMYAVIVINYQEYLENGKLSGVKVTVYATADHRELSYMEDVIYWV